MIWRHEQMGHPYILLTRFCKITLTLSLHWSIGVPVQAEIAPIIKGTVDLAHARNNLNHMHFYM